MRAVTTKLEKMSQTQFSLNWDQLQYKATDKATAIYPDDNKSNSQIRYNEI